MNDRTRAFDTTLDLAADPDTVWEALTRPTELVRWFPLEAEADLREGGTMRWSWGGAWTWETRIDALEPGRRLRLVQDAARPFDADGKPTPEGTAEPARIAIEFTLEGGGGSTRLRLVHSGFGRGAAWDDELDGVTHGWLFELRSLRHYLERFRGRDRRGAMVHVATSLSREAAWERLLAPGVFDFEAGTPVAGLPYRVRFGDGDALSGETLLTTPGRVFAGTARELGDGLFRIEIYRAGGRTSASCWISTWDPGVGALRPRAEAAKSLLESALPAPEGDDDRTLLRAGD